MSPAIVPITMPRWGIEMLRGTITGWHVAVGQPVRKGDALLEVETEKIVNSVEAPVGGVLRAVIVEKGAVADAGALIAVIADAQVSEDAIREFIRTFTAAGAGSSGAAAPAASSPVPAVAPVSPIAKRLAARLGVDPSKVKGTGMNGRVMPEDVEAYAASAAMNLGRAEATAAPAALPDTPPTRSKLSPTRVTIARRLLESTQGIPHYRLEIDADVSALIEDRASRNQDGRSRSFNDYVIRAAALALIKHPGVNTHLVGDETLTFGHADIGIAVVTDKGLITPVLRHADAKTLDEIATQSRDLAARARDGTLTHADIAGGTFTISNLGMYGIDRFDAIINPPQVAILAVAAAVERAVVRGGKIVARHLATLTLSADHRVVDGAAAAQFLGTLRQHLESPQMLC